MDVSTKNSTEKSLEKVSADKPISVYTVNFAKVIGKFPRRKFALKRKAEASAGRAQNSFSKKVFNRRNAVITAALLAVGVLHFAFQISFIRNEVSENRPVTEVPPVKIEPVSAVPFVEKSAETENRKSDDVVPSKTVRALRTPRQAESSTFGKPPPKKSVGSRAARLRRAEKILTGV